MSEERGAVTIETWGKSVVKVFLVGAVFASARFTAAVLGRWHSDVPERKVREIFSGSGVHFLRPHYYLPIPDPADLDAGYHLAGSGLPGLDMNDAAGLTLMEKVSPRQAFLAFNSRFEVLWAGNHLLLGYPGKVADTFPELAAMRERFPQPEPTRFWMRVRP
ncbi:MAG TPA: hypothetical protein VF847_01940 [Candidatus Deferrimicrobiaceae bacterium]